jgi:hypothetical protein
MRRLTYSCMRLTPYVCACMQRYANVPSRPDGRQRRRMCDRIRSMRGARYGCGYEVDTCRSDGSTTCSICSLNTRLVALAIQSIAFGARQWGHARRDSSGTITWMTERRVHDGVRGMDVRWLVWYMCVLSSCQARELDRAVRDEGRCVRGRCVA